MKATFLILSLLLGVLILFPVQSSATQCYECTNCDNVDSNTKIGSCTGSCLKVTHDIDGISRICSGYGDTEGCKRTEAQRTTICTCNKDLCNSGTKLKTPLTTFFLITGTAIFKTLFQNVL